MTKLSVMSVALFAATAGWITILAQDAKIPAASIAKGKAAFFNAADAAPGKARIITPKDLPAPGATKSATNFPNVAKRTNQMPIAPKGFKVELYATGLTEPRQIRTAPNGDLFFTEKKSGELKIARGYKDGKPESISVFAKGLDRPWGIAFYPADNPQWVYVGNAGSMVRFPYKAGALEASGAAQKLADLPIRQADAQAKGAAPDYHDTRDLAVSKDGKSIYVAVGSGSNIDDPDKVPGEKNRAAVLEFTPEGKFVGVYGSGIRNPVGMGVHPQTGEVWVSVNERDQLGDNLVPDYVTSVQKGGFYGWPYYYIGGNIDARLGNPHPELKSKVIVPDVLIQPHSASLGFSWYTGTAFPAEYRGDLFVAEHGSWNRENRSGAEVIRIPLNAQGKASGVYQDFLTGFADKDGVLWGRPASVAVGKDGALYITDDGSMSIWRVSYTGASGAKAKK
jgi:glucose/arabinose dehydrogenase